MSVTDQSKWEYRRLRLRLLVPYPAQDYFYTNTTTPVEDDAFQRALKSGQRDPIHVMPPKNAANLPAYTILDGRRRATALEANGEKEANVVVRHDLVGAERDTIEAVFLEFNCDRRQLHPLDKARIALRRFEIEKRRPRGGLRPIDEQEARDRVGKAIGMSGRNLQRYFRLLLTPREVQDAVRDGKLALVVGERVSWLSKDKQAEIAERIRAGEKAKDVVAGYLKPRSARHKHATAAFNRFVNHLKAALADMEDRPDEVYRLTLKENTPLLQRGRQLLTKLMAEGRKKPSSIANLFKDPNEWPLDNQGSGEDEA